MSSPIKLDQTDRKILNILQKHAKITNAQLSKDIDLSPAPTLERVKKLENSGIIESYHAKLNGHLLGLNIYAFVSVKLKNYNKKSHNSFISKIEDIDEVIESHSVTGKGDYLLKVVAKDVSAYEDVVRDRISAIDDVSSLESMVILSTSKDSKVIPVPQGLGNVKIELVGIQPAFFMPQNQLFCTFLQNSGYWQIQIF
eukprot:TRINITY_DN21097_c0_g1_i1.p1 TRINITY_DN21097_c0_g1~~TRINITY_DN21097_c0_g1_i1.p1  ORF type:complete len:198 (+),score=5.63 TRINITY_DN21097_c0_g1_i1:131-724(+)